MGDINDQQDVQQDEKPRSKLPFIIIGFGVLLLIIGVVAFLMMGGSSDASSPIAQPVDDNYYPYEFPNPFVGNLAPPDDQYLYNATVHIEIRPRGRFRERDALQELGIETEDPRTKRTRVLNAIHQELRRRTRSDLTSTAGQRALNTSIQNELNQILDKAEIINVYVFPMVN